MSGVSGTPSSHDCSNQFSDVVLVMSCVCAVLHLIAILLLVCLLRAQRNNSEEVRTLYRPPAMSAIAVHEACSTPKDRGNEKNQV